MTTMMMVMMTWQSLTHPGQHQEPFQPRLWPLLQR
jgi:hypothetical protein